MIRTFRNKLQEFKVIISELNNNNYSLSVFYKDLFSPHLDYKKYRGYNKMYKGRDTLNEAIEELVNKHNLKEVS